VEFYTIILRVGNPESKTQCILAGPSRKTERLFDSTFTLASIKAADTHTHTHKELCYCYVARWFHLKLSC